MRPVVVTVGPLSAASANTICLSQTPSAGALLINGASASGGVATLDVPRRVLITTTGNESAKTFVITGTDLTGNVVSESVAGPNIGTAFSQIDYKTVTSITISASAAAALTVGTNGAASSAWVRFDEWAPPSISIQCVASGTVNYTVQQTLNDPNSPTNPVGYASVTWFPSPDSNLVAATGNIQSNYAFMPTYARILLNSGTGSVTGTFIQNGNVQS
jgi:hypothetical protein